MIAQNKIAIVMDWDRTVIPDYMQFFLFKHFKKCSDEEAQEFMEQWLKRKSEYEKKGYDVDLAHSKAFIDMVPGVSNSDLRNAGEVAFIYNKGILELLPNLRAYLAKEEKYKDIEIIGSIVSSGYAEPINGSKLAKTLLDRPLTESDLEWLVFSGKFVEDEEGNISDVGKIVSMTEKTQQLYRINKGKHAGLNDTVPDDMREVPFEYMIYIGDGPSDIPAASVTRRGGGHVHMVYDEQDRRSIEQAFRIGTFGQRAHTIGSWDFRHDMESNHTYLMLEQATLQAANRMIYELNTKVQTNIVPTARHLNEL